MTTRIDPTGPAPVLHADAAAFRSTAQPTRPFQAVLSAGAAAVMGGAEAAVRRVPGGSILAAAFRPAAGQTLSAGSSSPTTAEGATTAEGYAVSGGATSGTGTGTDDSLEGMLDQNSDKNLYYIALQERISAENRLYSAYSNVLRVRHETMKNAIGNFR